MDLSAGTRNGVKIMTQDFNSLPAGMTEDDFTEVVFDGGPYDGRATKLENPTRTIQYGHSFYHASGQDSHERQVYRYDETA
jgi:hypothetical protein